MLSYAMRICSAFSHEKYLLSTTFKSSRNAGGSEAALKVSVILGLQVLTAYIHIHYSTQATKVPIYNGTHKINEFLTRNIDEQTFTTSNINTSIEGNANIPEIPRIWVIVIGPSS